jgi:hypothetical protein
MYQSYFSFLEAYDMIYMNSYHNFKGFLHIVV